jgi:hypothetical protein
MSPETPLRVERYRDNAEKCEVRAYQTSCPRLAVLFRDLADQWRNLAWQVEQIIDDAGRR